MKCPFDPFQPDQGQTDIEVLAQLRRAGPVIEVLPQYFLVTRYADIESVLLNSATFTQGGLGSQGSGRPIDESNLGELNPPYHTEIRRPMAKALAPSRMPMFEPHVREIAAELLGEITNRAQVDLAQDFAVPFVLRSVLRLTGISRDEIDRVRSFTADFIMTLSEPRSEKGVAAARRCREFEQVLRELIDRRRSGETNDVPDVLDSLLATVDQQGQPLSERRLLTHFAKDVVAGAIDTTTHAIGNLMYEVLSQDGTYQLLRDNRHLRAAAIEESLRHDSPATFVLRDVAVDVDIAGVKVPRGSKIILSLTSAGRDESVYNDPDRFDVHRFEHGGAHLAFSKGIHLCVAATQARLMVGCALDALLDGIPSMKLASSARYQRCSFSQNRGTTQLLVELESEATGLAQLV